MTDRTGVDERRQYARIAPKGTVILLAGEHAQRARITNISHGGLFATTKIGPPERLLARTISMEIRLDGQLAEWIHVAGRVARIVADGFAVSFTSVPAPLVRAIEAMSSESYVHRRRLSVVLIDSDAERRAVMAEGFRGLGSVVIEGSTPLEAIVRLGESSFEPDLIAIADSMPSTVAEDLRRFVALEHPFAKLVTIGVDIDGPSGIVHWLSATDPQSNLLARVRDIVTKQHRS